MESNSIMDRFKEIEIKRENRNKGIVDFIPFFKHFPRFSKYIPGFLPGVMYKLLSQTNVGKSQFTKFMSIILPYEGKEKYGYKYKVLYFSLEESYEDFIDKLIVYRIKQKHGIIIDPLKIKSYTEDLLSDEEMVMIAQVLDEVSDMLRDVEIVDNISRNPTGLYKYTLEKSKEWGTHYYQNYKTLEIINHVKYDETYKSQNKEGLWRYHHYETDYLILMVCDQVNNLALEKDTTSGLPLDKRGVMKKWSFDYCRDEFTKKWGWIVLNVQQLTAEGENLEHLKHDKLKPSLDKAGESKEILQDDMVIMSLFNPSRYKLKANNGYDIGIFQDKFREVGVHKNRLGRVGMELGVYFEGASGTFKELPRADDTSKMDNIYNKLKRNEL